ncbi:MAG: universal stress protein [Solirubrobacteraceae bacterium]
MAAPDARPALVAFDGSAEAQAAVREAVALFGDRPLAVVTIWEPGLAAMVFTPPPGEVGATYVPDPDALVAVDRAESDHAERVAQAGAELARGLGATAEAVSVPDTADVAETLVAIAEQRGARAIVIGTRGAHGFRAHVTGSTTQRLLRHARCPVLVVRASA